MDKRAQTTARSDTAGRWHERVSLPPRPGAAEAFDAAIQALIDEFDAEEIWVYGSCARGSPSRDSDVDFLVVRPHRPDCPRPAVAARLCLGRLPHFLPADLIVLDPAQWSARRERPFGVYSDIVHSGIQIYARQSGKPW